MMSAWHVFAQLGFYPVDPCGGENIRSESLVRHSVKIVK